MITELDLPNLGTPQDDKVIEVQWNLLTVMAYEYIDSKTYGRLDIITLKHYERLEYMYGLMIANNIIDPSTLPVGRLVKIYTPGSILDAIAFVDIKKIPGVNDKMVSENVKYNNDIKVIMTKENKKRRLDASRSIGVNGIELKHVHKSGNKIVF
jgi:hypothetical protein